MQINSSSDTEFKGSSLPSEIYDVVTLEGFVRPAEKQFEYEKQVYHREFNRILAELL